jgi:hypothetical protein
MLKRLRLYVYFMTQNRVLCAGLLMSDDRAYACY